MTDQQEKLSALLDDYRDDDENRALLRDLQADVNQQYTIQRYQMIGDVMRKELPDQIQLDLVSRVRASVAAEPKLSADAVTAAAESSRRARTTRRRRERTSIRREPRECRSRPATLPRASKDGAAGAARSPEG